MMQFIQLIIIKKTFSVLSWLNYKECKFVNRKNILVVGQYFYPEQFRINDICKEWVKRGYDVTVITGIPNYPKG